MKLKNTNIFLMVFIYLFLPFICLANNSSVTAIIENQGLKEEFYSNGQKKFEYFLKKNSQGKFVIHGPKKIWYRSGQLRGIEQYDNGTSHGKWLYFYENGKQYNEIFFTKGKKTGLWKRWHEKGHLIDTVLFTYKNKNQIVKQTTYSPSKKIIKEEHYKNGKKHGLTMTFDKTGKVLTKNLFIDGIQQESL